MNNTNEENKKKTCFIITPIGNPLDPIRRHIDGIIDAAIRPALGEEYEIKVAHQMFSTGSINKQVIEEIYYCDLAIANLTNKNPNVMYELAFRHCLGKPIIQIMEDGTNLPFDIINERTISYINDSKGVLELKDALINFVKEINFEGKNQGPIYDVLKHINKEVQIFESFEKDSKVEVDKDILKYLLNRIDKIDSKLENNSYLNKNEIIIENNKYLDKNNIKFKRPNRIKLLFDTSVSDSVGIDKSLDSLLADNSFNIDRVLYFSDGVSFLMKNDATIEAPNIAAILNEFTKNGVKIESIFVD